MHMQHRWTFIPSLAFRRGEAVATAVVAMLSLGAPALAQRILAVDPPAKMYEAHPGEQVTGSFTILNPGGTPVRAVLSVTDWHYLEDGSPEYPDAGTLDRSLSPWITFTPSEVLLDAGARAIVRYTVAVPENAEAGSHWGVVFVTGMSPDPAPPDELASFTVRVGHVIYVNLPPEEPKGEIAGIYGQLSEDQQSNDSYLLAIQYANTGNVAQQLRGYLELRDASGTVRFRHDFRLRVTLPGETSVRTVRLYGPLEAGPYSALVVYNYGDRNTDVAGEYGFVLSKALPEPTLVDKWAGQGPAAVDGAP